MLVHITIGLKKFWRSQKKTPPKGVVALYDDIRPMEGNSLKKTFSIFLLSHQEFLENKPSIIKGTRRLRDIKKSQH
jgi:hypothetical protein